jgi:predicted  nucleic acid-binding Zn-ribbon protein
MQETLRNIVELQEIELGATAGATAHARIEELRGKIPPQILGHYDRLIARGKKGIVPVQGQTCGGCHMRQPLGVITILMKAADIQLCDSCGRYLYLPEASAPPVTSPAMTDEPEPPAKRKRTSRKKE